MKKFLFGAIVGAILVISVNFGVNLINAESNADYGNLTEQQSKEMQLAWYQYHHDDLIKGLSGKCE